MQCIAVIYSVLSINTTFKVLSATKHEIYVDNYRLHITDNSWQCGSVVETLAGKLSLACTTPAADR